MSGFNEWRKFIGCEDLSIILPLQECLNHFLLICKACGVSLPESKLFAGKKSMVIKMADDVAMENMFHDLAHNCG